MGPQTALIVLPDTKKSDCSAGVIPHLGLHLAGGEHRLQPVLRILSHAYMALCRSIRLRVLGTGGRGGTQL